MCGLRAIFKCRYNCVRGGGFFKGVVDLLVSLADVVNVIIPLLHQLRTDEIALVHSVGKLTACGAVTLGKGRHARLEFRRDLPLIIRIHPEFLGCREESLYLFGW